MVNIEFKEIFTKFLIQNEEDNGYIDLDTGCVFWVPNRPFINIEDHDQIPSDFHTSEKYIPLPSKNEIIKYSELISNFVAKEIPSCEEKVAILRTKKGFFGKYRDLLASKGVLNKWFSYENEALENELKKWLKENNIKTTDEGEITKKDTNNDFEKSIKNSIKDHTGRKNRLRNAPKKPLTIETKILSFIRNPDVVAEVLIRANGICESCKNPAPFLRASDNTPYLEVHHKKFLSDGGDDSVENAEALCPNCHRQKHYG